MEPFMTLAELKLRLKILDDTQDAYYQIVLEDAVDYVREYCNCDFADGCPPGVKRAITLMVRSSNENSNVASQSLGDMSKSFFPGGTLQEAEKLLRPYRKVRFR